MEIGTAYIIAAITAMYGVISTGFIATYKGRIKDLQEQVRYLRKELDELQTHDHEHP